MRELAAPVSALGVVVATLMVSVQKKEVKVLSAEAVSAAAAGMEKP